MFYGRHNAQHQLQWSQIKIRNEIKTASSTNAFQIFKIYKT